MLKSSINGKYDASEHRFPTKRSPAKAVDELVDRAQANGTSLKDEAMKEQQAVKEEMAKQREETKKPIKTQKTAVEAKKEAKPTVEPLKPQKPLNEPKIKGNKPKKEEVDQVNHDNIQLPFSNHPGFNITDGLLPEEEPNSK